MYIGKKRLSQLIEEAKMQGYTKALDDHQILHGEEAKRLIDEMKANESKLADIDDRHLEMFKLVQKNLRFEVGEL